MNSSTKRAVFLDRDGTINHDTGYLTRPEELVLYPWAADAIKLINDAHFATVVITNQGGVARGLCGEEEIRAINDKMIDDLAKLGARIDAVYYCPHHPAGSEAAYRVICECRKPQPGMLRQAAEEHCLLLEGSYVIGDKVTDIEAAVNVGATPALVLTGYGERTRLMLAESNALPGIVSATLLEAVAQILDRL
ncbi:MAG TPA: HAD family hydrolase [Blastocatellia bacterium]|nr:HAD family hydrolase [Blastocatellia bacterium]